MSAIDTDAVVIGAGPVGLFQVFELGLLEMRAHVVDSLPFVGGQCVELYGDKPIYDIPGLPYCTGRELVDRLQKQIEPFAPVLHLGQEVSRVEKTADGRFAVGTSAGVELLAKAVVIAGGVGSFRPKKLKVDGLEAFEGAQLFHHAGAISQGAGRKLVIVGGDEAAVDAALHFASMRPEQAPSAITLMHRRDQLAAPDDKLAKLAELRGAGRVQFIAGQVIGFDAPQGWLSTLKLLGADGQEHALAADLLLVLLGLSPRLGPIADWGLHIERKQVVVDTEKFETGTPGLFAVGDICSYPGKRKLIVSGFHEATLAAFAAAQHVFPDKPVLLQYTTTSPRLHELLGVAPG